MGQHVGRALFPRRRFDRPANLQPPLLFGGVILAVHPPALQFGMAEVQIADAGIHIISLTIDASSVEPSLGQPLLEFLPGASLSDAVNLLEKLFLGQRVIMLDAFEHVALELQFLAFRRDTPGACSA
jgi:hypothetical protein